MNGKRKKMKEKGGVKIHTYLRQRFKGENEKGKLEK